MVWGAGISALVTAIFWQGLLAFLILTLSLVLFCPVLLMATERTPLYGWRKHNLMILAVVTGAGLVVALILGSTTTSLLFGVLFDGVIYVLSLPRPNNTVERDGPQAARPSL